MNKLKSASFIFLSLFLVVIFSGCQNNTATNDSQKKEEISNVKNDEKIEEIKYKKERTDALSFVQAYKIQKTINEGNSKFEVKLGTKLYDVFKLQKQSGYIDSNGRWVVVKDGEGFVVIYRSNSLGESLNNPQWSVISEDIKALNGTATKYTPELGYNVVVDSNEKSKALKFYLRWDELMTKDNWNDEKNQINLDKVAKEFSVSSSEADSLLVQGEVERNNEVKQTNEKRGEILSDEKLVELLKEQGDLYVPEN